MSNSQLTLLEYFYNIIGTRGKGREGRGGEGGRVMSCCGDDDVRSFSNIFRGHPVVLKD